MKHLFSRLFRRRSDRIWALVWLAVVLLGAALMLWRAGLLG
jgi:hypothetical protein